MRKPSFLGFTLILVLSVILRLTVVDGSLFDDVIDKGASTKKRELTYTNFSAGPSLASQADDYDDELYAYLEEQSLNTPRETSSGDEARDKNQIIINLKNAPESYLVSQSDDEKASHHKLTEYSMAAPQNEEELNKFVRESYGTQSSPIQVPTSYTQFQGPIAVHFNTYNDELESEDVSLFAPPSVYGNNQDSPQQDANRRPKYNDRQPRDGSQSGSLFSPAQFDSVGPPAAPLSNAFNIGPPAPPVPVRPPLPVAPVRPPAPPPSPPPTAPPNPTRPPAPVGPSPGEKPTKRRKKAKNGSHPSIYTHVNLHINNEIAPEYGGYEEPEEETQQDFPVYDQVEASNDPIPVYQPPSQDPPQLNNPVNDLPQYQTPFQADFSDAQAQPSSGYQAPSFDSAAFNPSTGYSPPVQANPQNNYQAPFQSPIQSNPSIGYQAPAQANPSTGYQAPAQANPSTGYQAPAQANPSTGYQAPAQANPSTGYQAPAQANPSTGYQAPAQSPIQANPTSSYTATIQFDPSAFYQAPSLNNPVQGLQSPIQNNPNQGHQSQPQTNPAPVYQAPQSNPIRSYQAPQNDPAPVYQAPQSNPTPSYQAPQSNPTPSYQAPQSNPTPSYQAPQSNPSPNYQAPQSNPTPSYQAPQSDPTPSYQAPQNDPASVYKAPQSNPTPSYQTPQSNPTPSYQAPQSDPTPSYQGPQNDPTPVYQAPQSDPIPVYQAPQSNPTPSYKAPQNDPTPVHQAPQNDPSPGYQPQPQSNPTPSYQPLSQANPTSTYEASVPIQANPTANYGAPPQSNPSRPSYNAPTNDAPQNSPRLIQSNPNFVLASPVLFNANSFQNSGVSYSFAASDAQQDPNAVHYHVHVADAQGLQDVQQLFDDTGSYDAPRDPTLANPMRTRRPKGHKYRSRRNRGQRQSDPRLRSPIQRNGSGVSEILKLKCLLWCGFKQYEF